MAGLIFNVCFPVAEVKVIEATLPLTGYTPYVCDEEAEPVEVLPEDQVRYQRQTISANWLAANNFVYEQGKLFPLWGPISYGDGKTTEEVRQVDPYTGLTCITGDVGFTVPSGLSEDEEQCTETTRVFVGDDITDPCDSERTITKTVTYDLSIPYGVDEVATLAENMLNLFAWTDLPAYGTKGTVLPGTDGEKLKSALMVSPAGSNWSAAYIRNGTTVTKRKLYLKFLIAATYTKRTTIGGVVTEEVLEAEQGEEIEIESPLTPDTTIEILACQFLSECLLSRVGSSEFSSKGESQKRIADPDWEPGEDECLQLYVSGDDRFFERLEDVITSTESGSRIFNYLQRDSIGAEELQDVQDIETSYTSNVSRTVTTVSTPCENISVSYSGGGTRTSSFTTVFPGDENSGSCTETITAGEDGFTTNSAAQGDYLADANGNCSVSGECGFEGVSVEVNWISEGGEVGKDGDCVCPSEPGTPTVLTEDFLVEDGLLGEPTYGGSGSITKTYGDAACENTSYSFTGSGTSREESYSYSYSDIGFSVNESGNCSASSTSSQTQTLTNEITDPFDKRGKVDGEPTESENITCASRNVSETSSTWTTVSDVKWELEIEPSQLRDTNGNPLEHTTYFQYILSELDSEDPYCPELTYTEYYLPSDVRVPSVNADGQVKGYELTFNGPNLSVSSPRRVDCIIHSQAILEIAYDL